MVSCQGPGKAIILIPAGRDGFRGPRLLRRQHPGPVRFTPGLGPSGGRGCPASLHLCGASHRTAGFGVSIALTGSFFFIAPMASDQLM